MPNRRPQLQLISAPAAASPEEAAAIVAAVERFMRATAPSPASPPPSSTRGAARPRARAWSAIREPMFPAPG